MVRWSACTGSSEGYDCYGEDRQGNLSNVEPVGDGVSEYKIDWGPGYRVYFGQDGDSMVILVGGGAKKRQAADIAAAKKQWAAYKKRKKHLGEGK